MGDFRVRPHKPPQRRQQYKSQQNHRCRNDPIHPFIEASKPGKLLPVTCCKRLVHTVSHGRAEAQICQGEHGEDVTEQPLNAQIVHAETAEEHRSVDEGQ